MRSQMAKRMNINLTQKQIEELEFIKTCKLYDRYIDSDIIRDAIDAYAVALGYKNSMSYGYRLTQGSNICP